MRPWWVLLVAVAVLLAGCSKPTLRTPAKEVEEAPLELPEPDLAKGDEFGRVNAPTWRSGFHFTYEEEGAVQAITWTSSKDSNHTQVDDAAWGPRQGLNYTVVNTEDAFGDTRYLALQHDETGAVRDLLAFSPDRLQPLGAYTSTSCTHHLTHSCTTYVGAWQDADAAPALDFPLEQDALSKTLVDEVQRPYVPASPVVAATRILGLKEVEGPNGPVQAIHVHQSFAINATRATQRMADALQGVATNVTVTGNITATRDVYYAFGLSNVVLDVAVSQGTKTVSYVVDGRPLSSTETWRWWSTQRLTGVSFAEKPAMVVEEIDALLHAGLDPEVALDQTVQLTTDRYSVNVADGESWTFDVSLGSDVDHTVIEVYNGDGLLVTNSGQRRLTYTPPVPGPYLVMAKGFDADGLLLDRSYTSLEAYYEATVDSTCQPLSVQESALVPGLPPGGCPRIPVPLGPSIMYLYILASTREAAAVGGPLPGRLVLDMMDGQQLSSPRGSGFASLHVTQPRFDPDLPTWDLFWEPDPGVGTSVTYEITLYPGFLPSLVYQVAFDNEDD